MEKKEISWRKLDYLDSKVSTSEHAGETLLHLEPSALTALAKEAFHDISHLHFATYFKTFKNMYFKILGSLKV